MVEDTVMPMAWNEPGNNNGKRPDTWGKNTGNDNKNEEGPPDLDQVFKQIKDKLKSAFGVGSGGNGNDKKNGGNTIDAEPNKPDLSYKFLAALILLLYIGSGFYIVKPAEQGIVTRFGKYNISVGPGPHWYPQFIENKKIVNTEQLISVRQAGTMLTKDENLVSVEIQVQYRVTDINKYLFKVVEPERSLKEAAESALRQAVGHNKLDFIITSGRAEIEEQTRKQIINTLDNYNAGLYIAAVTLKEAKAPEQVKAAFDDVTRAREDRERFIHEAESYYNKIVPEAKGQAQQIVQEADAYKQEVINRSIGDANRFNLVLPEYRKAPQVTKTRLYLDSMEQVLSNSNKVLVDVNSGNNLIYLPLDRMVQSSKSDVNYDTNKTYSSSSDDDKAKKEDDKSYTRSYDRRRDSNDSE